MHKVLGSTFRSEKLQFSGLGAGQEDGGLVGAQDRLEDNRILLVSHEMSYTGAPRSLLNMAYILRELGWRPEVWTLKPGEFSQEFAREEIPVETVSFPKEASESLAERISGYRFVIANTVFCAAFASYAGRFAQTVLYLREAGNLPQLIADCHLNGADITKAKHLVCVSRYAEACIQREYHVPEVLVIPNYVEDWLSGRGKPAEDRLGRKQHRVRRTAGNSRPVRFMVSGTVEPRKGQDIAVKAFLALPAALREKAQLYFAGPMPEWARSYQEALKIDSHRNIFYRGEVRDREKLFELYQSMDVMLVASRDEACSLAALEAAMLGKALLVTEHTGAKYLVSPDCVLPTGDAAALCAKMAEYLCNPRRIAEEGAENRKRYLEYGTKEQYRQNLDRFLKKLTEDPAWAGRQKPGNRVSVVVPVYNAGKYLRACMDSLLGQTLPGMEVIVVNDGSTDGSLCILEEYAEKASEPEHREMGSVLRVVSMENHGYGHAVNCGMRMASGEYVGIVEPDDYVDCTMYEKLYHYALAADAEIVKSDFFRFTGEGKTQRNVCWRTAREDANYGRIICPAQEKESFRFLMNTWCGIYRREFLEKCGIRHNETPGASYQDNGFWFQGFCHAERIIFLREPLYYNRRDNAESSVNQRGKVYCANEEYAHIRRFLSEHSDLEKEFLYQYSVKKYHTYLFTLDRIAWEYKREYLERFSEEFHQAEREGELSQAAFTPQEWGNLHWIMRDPEGYFRKKVEGEIQISVILPVYNVEKYLVQCLESLENQQFGKFEVICVDDGSTDASVQMIRETAARDRRFRLFSQANAGAGAARNTGLRMAKGRYVIFLDADDYFAPEMLLRAWQKIRETDADICVMGSWQYDEQTGETMPCTYSLQLQNYPAWRPFRADQMSCNPFRAFVGWAWDKLYRRDFLLNHGLEFQEQRTSNDMYFTYLSLLKADKITTLEERVIYQRRNREDSLSATRGRSWNCFFDALSAIRMELERMGLYRRYRLYFDNYAVHSCLWNLMTLPEEAAHRLLEKLRGGWLEELGIASFGEKEAEYPAEYAAYREIIDSGEAGLARCRAAYRERQAQTAGKKKNAAERRSSGGKSPADFRDEASFYRYCLEEIRRSKSYQIGLAATWLFRKLRGWIRGVRRGKISGAGKGV